MGNDQLCEHGLDLVEASVQGLPPVVYYINIGTIITWFIEPLHCHCLRISTKLLSLHFDIGVLTGQVCPGGETSHASRDGECLTSIKQFVEMLASGRSWTDCAELYPALVCCRLGSGATVADSETY